MEKKLYNIHLTFRKEDNSHSPSVVTIKHIAAITAMKPLRVTLCVVKCDLKLFLCIRFI